MIYYFQDGAQELLFILLWTWQTTSKRLAERKVAKFQKNIMKRGSVPETSVKKGYDYPVGPILLGFFVFVVIGSCMYSLPSYHVVELYPFPLSLFSKCLIYLYFYIILSVYLVILWYGVASFSETFINFFSFFTNI